MFFAPTARLLAAAAVALAAAIVRADDAVPALVTFSDGTSQSGSLKLIGARPLTLVPLGENKQRMFLFRDIVSVGMDIETNSMERPWVFKESGRAEKVYLDGQYPLMNFTTRITLVNGQTVSGHIISAALTLSGEKGKKKIFLTRQIKGEIGQTLNDIVFIRDIRFTGNAVAGGGPIRGSVEGFGKVLSVTALDNAREQVLTAAVTADNRFDFGNVLPGSYDLCVLTDTHALVGLSDAAPADRTGAPLQDGDLAAVNVKFPLANDFFNDRWIVRLTGNRSFAKALVYERRSNYYEASKWTPGGFLWHVEIWSWHLADPEWKLDHRNQLIRHKQKGGEQNRKLMLGKTLGAVAPNTTLHIDAGADNHATWTFIRDLN